ncbi:DNA gyrase subunit A [Defluviicoccus vanus]|uniref:DNA gyrase subunit A n=1 Tax=Defluviicoccus vanus TaxID=111831 RepID=A0A7H1N593_9PROT|nr:DNA gyrase subunit A [Defluviicoccus vanus]QNT70879.1 DNA gyrase subunit A [Defluviicoccus vanus]
MTVPVSELTPVAIEEEMRRSYLDYAMSVIVSRALPDARDGLKPVQRRIIYAMYENGYTHDKPFRKSARIVGDVMGKYHPHGDSAIYDALVRMAQSFAMRLPLIDGQGNFGSMDGDRAAAMRYTEARLARSAHALIEDIDENTVDFEPNYDDSDTEPTVLPARYPNLLVNGAGGIAVGMATNIPPHNLGEVIDACCALIDDPMISINELMEKHIPGPDFPTGAIVLGRQGIVSAYLNGRGSLVMRAKTRFETLRKERAAIVVDEVPYQVNKARMVEIIGEAVRDKKIEGISDLRDESDRDGIRVVIELKRDAEPEVVLNQLYRHTPLQTTFGMTLLALDGRRPRTMTIKELLEAFLVFREEVIRRRTTFLLRKARERAHVLVGLAIAVVNIDEIIATIRRSPDPAAARSALTARGWPIGDVMPLILLVEEAKPGEAERTEYWLSDEQARAILDLRLHRLTGLEREKVGDELRTLGAQIAEYLGILGSRATLLALMRKELLEIKAQFANPRRSLLVEEEPGASDEDLIQREDMVVTVTNTGYIKRVPLSTYRAQRRGGKGRSGMSIRDEDFVSQVFVVSTHQPVLFFSSAGLVYKLKVYKLPPGTPQSRGKAMINLLPLQPGETITALLPLPEDAGRWAELYVIFATASGYVRRNSLSDFFNVPSSGKIAMKLDPGDRLVRVRTFTEADDILLFTRHGQCIRFAVGEVRVFSGRTSTGVRGLKLGPSDAVISMSGLFHVEADASQRDEYLRAINARRRLLSSDYAGKEEERARDEALASKLDHPEFSDMAEREEFLLTVTEDGFGKRTSSYEYRITGRDGSGVNAIDLSRPGGETRVVAAFPVFPTDQIVMVTETGQLIRCPVKDISVMGRTARGVKLFNMTDADRVVSVTRIRDVEDGGEGEDADASGPLGSDPSGGDPGPLFRERQGPPDPQ